MRAVKCPNRRNHRKSVEKMDMLSQVQLELAQLCFKNIAHGYKHLCAKERRISRSLKRKRIFLDQEGFDIVSAFEGPSKRCKLEDGELGASAYGGTFSVPSLGDDSSSIVVNPLRDCPPPRAKRRDLRRAATDSAATEFLAGKTTHEFLPFKGGPFDEVGGGEDDLSLYESAQEISNCLGADTGKESETLHALRVTDHHSSMFEDMLPSYPEECPFMAAQEEDRLYFGIDENADPFSVKEIPHENGLHGAESSKEVGGRGASIGDSLLLSRRASEMIASAPAPFGELSANTQFVRSISFNEMLEWSTTKGVAAHCDLEGFEDRAFRPVERRNSCVPWGCTRYGMDH